MFVGATGMCRFATANATGTLMLLVPLAVPHQPSSAVVVVSCTALLLMLLLDLIPGASALTCEAVCYRSSRSVNEYGTCMKECGKKKNVVVSGAASAAAAAAAVALPFRNKSMIELCCVTTLQLPFAFLG
ncbi:unnamed protein product [Soboliphyme baturini]|uniref:Secreted protein n=1 Tax=Soboliphyme baturini TaxID=241478 RepID=A0A183IZP2_9BILA|nr:unnamed protein product [Soboliphyme baturini]